ncbi:glycosyltransferase family 4 protein [Methanolobus sp.]|uniref:glycosyltransferase family 4 protein n=1 Tax=Methanolobus sp. TaxID=1874737 RepID=UPI0025D571EF|nr:glycosyltransferase family 4 protein [Methanolobus sp.]
MIPPIQRTQIEKTNVCMIAYRSIPKFMNRLKIAQSLCEKECDVDFICILDENQQSEEKIYDVNVIRINGDHQRKDYSKLLYNYISFITRSFFKVLDLNRTKRYSYFHIHTPPDFLIVIAIPFKLIYGSRIILDLHDMFPEAVESNLRFKGSSILVKLSEMIERISISFSDAIIATNSYDKEIIASRNKVDPDKIFVVMNTPNLKQYTIENAVKKDYGLENKFIVLFQGTVWKRRGIQTIIDSVNQLKNKIPIYLIIVGDGPFVENLKDIVAEKDLNDLVEFTGWVDLNTLSKYISMADVCVIPFLKTKVNERGVPNKLFEYTIHEKPIIASRLKGMALTFSEKEILFYEPGNADDLAEKILWCFNNPEETRKMISDAKRRYEEEYSWEKMENELLRSYDSFEGKCSCD